MSRSLGQPVSIDELLKKKRAQANDEAKPVFLSKAERERQKAELAAAATSNQQNASTSSKSKSNGYAPAASHNRGPPPSGPRSMRPPEPDMPPPPLPPPAFKRAASELDAPSNLIGQGHANAPVIDENLIKSRYLGAHVDKKRKIRKMSDKKFVFDWDKGDDTGALVETSDSFQQGPSKGFTRPPPRAPIDESVVPARHSEVDNVDRDDVPLAGPAVGSNGGRKQRGALDERHWSEKDLKEMKERDWRIFREDFSIAARGQSHQLIACFAHAAS
jgi:ATP-dependent RNA helicase DDX23/PRP28